ncbi:MAG: type II toxin-antitoxin system HicB family antitoxin [Bacteroidales bacterium]|jgi:predicted RNase H-like HicB family nuclease|nr:type II toxin-antitoxin system HicB family antitoxin [Bacteroidales bacterium]
MKTKIEAVIERASDGGYGIYLPAIVGVTATGSTESEAKDNLLDAIKEVADYRKEMNLPDDLNGGEVSIEYKYDLTGFFKAYDVFDVSSLAHRIGINSSLMRRYKTGRAYISQTQKNRIENGIHDVARQLLTVKF